jgi:hypothetical protein
LAALQAEEDNLVSNQNQSPKRRTAMDTNQIIKQEYIDHLLRWADFFPASSSPQS